MEGVCVYCVQTGTSCRHEAKMALVLSTNIRPGSQNTALKDRAKSIFSSQLKEDCKALCIAG
jgi:Mg-chelatase subunit ChlI